MWRESDAGAEWSVDADLPDYGGTLDHDTRRPLVAPRVADGGVRTRLAQRRTAGSRDQGRRVPTPQGPPPGGGRSPGLRHRLLTPCDRELRRRGYPLPRYADDGAITCRSRREAEAAWRIACTMLARRGVPVNPQKPRSVHVRHGVAGLGYTITRGSRGRGLPPATIRSGARRGDRAPDPTQQSVDRFTDARRRKTRRRMPLRTAELIRERNPGMRGWGAYDTRAHVRRLFKHLDRWGVRRLGSHRPTRWRCPGGKTLPMRRLRGELGLVRLVSLLPSGRLRPGAAAS